MISNGGEMAAPGLLINRGARLDDLMTVVRAVPTAVPAVRALMRDWLVARDWPIDPAADIVLAVNEALANVVDHAYPPGSPGSATLHAWISTHPASAARRAVVTVTDRGRWAAHHPASPDPTMRGHGLIMMSDCMAELHIQRAVAGTTVIMVSATVPAGSVPGEQPSSPVAAVVSLTDQQARRSAHRCVLDDP